MPSKRQKAEQIVIVHEDMGEPWSAADDPLSPLVKEIDVTDKYRKRLLGPNFRFKIEVFNYAILEAGTAPEVTPDNTGKIISFDSSRHKISIESAEKAMDLLGRGCKLEEQGKYEEAFEAYKQGLDVNPANPSLCINIGTLFYRQGQYPEAELFYRKATKIDPDYALAWFDLGNTLEDLKQPADAIAAYQAALKIAPKYEDAHYNIALVYQQIGESKHALGHWVAYTKLAARDEWHDYARKQIEKIRSNIGLTIIAGNPDLLRKQPIAIIRPYTSVTGGSHNPSGSGPRPE